MNYDIRASLIYAVGQAIDHEEDERVRAQLEDLEDKLTTGVVRAEVAA